MYSRKKLKLSKFNILLALTLLLVIVGIINDTHDYLFRYQQTSTILSVIGNTGFIYATFVIFKHRWGQGYALLAFIGLAAVLSSIIDLAWYIPFIQHLGLIQVITLARFKFTVHALEILTGIPITILAGSYAIESYVNKKRTRAMSDKDLLQEYLDSHRMFKKYITSPDKKSKDLAIRILRQGRYDQFELSNRDPHILELVSMYDKGDLNVKQQVYHELKEKYGEEAVASLFAHLAVFDTSSS